MIPVTQKWSSDIPVLGAPTRFVIAWVHRDRASRSGDGVFVVRHVDLDRSFDSSSAVRPSSEKLATETRRSFPCAGFPISDWFISSVLLSSPLHGYAVQTVHFTHQRPPRFSARNLPRRIRESTPSGLMWFIAANR